jgi:hypothetical protein
MVKEETLESRALKKEIAEELYNDMTVLTSIPSDKDSFLDKTNSLIASMKHKL